MPAGHRGTLQRFLWVSTDGGVDGNHRPPVPLLRRVTTTATTVTR
jgi:hypothetical protein